MEDHTEKAQVKGWVNVVLLIAGRLAREIDNVSGSLSHALLHFA